MSIPPLTLYVMGWLTGIGLAPYVEQPVWVWLSFSALGLVGAVIARRKTAWRNLAIAIAMLGLGAARWASAQPAFDERFIATYNDSGAVTIEGIVVDEPDVRDTYTNLRVEADTLILEGAESALPIRGSILVQVPRYPPINYGERIRAQGLLQSPPQFEDFDYADYLARQSIYSILRRANAEVISNFQSSDLFLNIQLAIFKPIYALKSRALAAISETFPEPQGALLSGILLGVETGIPESLKTAFRITGTSHIVAISGFNIAIIVKVFASLFKRLAGERRAIPLSIVAVAAYAVLAGADASVVRAALMGSIVLVAGGFNRPSSGLASLAAAAFVMTAFSPGTLWDVGFQLSVAATLGLIVYATPFTQAATQLLARFTKPEIAERIVGTVGEFSILTVAAQVTTLPLIAFYFHQISIISLVANIIVLPVQPQVMILGGLAAIGAMIAKPLGAILFWFAWPFVTFTIVMVELLAKVPLAAIQIDRFSVGWLFGAYGAIVGLTWLFGRESNDAPRWWEKASGWLSSASLATMAVITLAVWNLYLHQPDGKLRVTFLNVGHGDAVLIQTPTGRYALIDGGPGPNALAESLGRWLPIGARTLDVVVTASPKPDSLGGLPGLFDRFDIGQAVLSGEAGRSAAYREWSEGLTARNVPVTVAEVGLGFDLGEGAVLRVINVNDDGATLRLDYGNASFLFPAGLEAKSSTELAGRGAVLPATVLLAPDHAGKNSISALFLDAAQPQAIVIAVGDGNRPDDQMLALFAGRTILRTDERGAISFATDGRQLWVESER